MTFINNNREVQCDGCLNMMGADDMEDWVSYGTFGGERQHYHGTCWQTGWYTGIEPKGEWPGLCEAMDRPLDPAVFAGEEPEPTFDHVRSEVRTVSRTGGEKGVKPARFDLVPVGPLTTVAKLYGKGAAKYEDRNWERGYEWSKSYAALMRHVTQFWGGEDLDPDTQLPHLASVVFHAMALMQFMDEHRSFDDRPRVANGDSIK